MKQYGIYSLADTRVILSHPSVGQCVLSDTGAGKFTIAYSGDISSHTATAAGYVVINKLSSHHGSLSLEVSQNSEADHFLRRWASWMDSSSSSSYSDTTLTVRDEAAGKTITLSGVTPQRIPDLTYDQSSGSQTWVLLAAVISEK